jgi:hypothetical protein
MPPSARAAARATAARRPDSGPWHRGGGYGSGSRLGGAIGLGMSPESNDPSAALGIGIGDRHRLEQRLRVRIQRAAEQRGLVGQLDDAAEVHHRDAVADVLDHREVVGDEK